jgi:hypothetical protein
MTTFATAMYEASSLKIGYQLPDLWRHPMRRSTGSHNAIYLELQYKTS